MALTRGTLAAREAFGSRRVFDEVRRTDHFNVLATQYVKSRIKPGQDWGRMMAAARAPTSAFAQAYGKAYFKDGKVRSSKQLSVAPRGAISRLVNLTGVTPAEEAAWRHYVVKE